MIRSSQAAVDFIVNAEVSGKEAYTKYYMAPEWPGGASGVTVGIGYDLGYATATRIGTDWGMILRPYMVDAMQTVAGITGIEAQNALHQVKGIISISWEAAMIVFADTDMPRWEAIVIRAIPRSIELSPDCFGAIVSLAYNRGASFSSAGPRYIEMRNIRALIQSGDFARVPNEFRKMKRLWPNITGLRNRREGEALLFEQGLRIKAVPVASGEATSWLPWQVI